ncbi:putative fibronectin type 3 [Trypoxylus dichotomus]
MLSGQQVHTQVKDGEPTFTKCESARPSFNLSTTPPVFLYVSDFLGPDRLRYFGYILAEVNDYSLMGYLFMTDLGLVTKLLIITRFYYVSIPSILISINQPIEKKCFGDRLFSEISTLLHIIMDKSFLHIKVISLYLLISAVCRVSYSCSGFAGQGMTYPIGDISIEYNTSTPLEIMCIITNESLIEKYPNISSYLAFEKNKSRVPADKIIRLNETSIKLVERNLQKMNEFYSCVLNGSVICLNNVAVGTQPQEVTDFNCIAYNYENMTCSWTPPKNYIPTNYTLSYTFPHLRPGKHKHDKLSKANRLSNQKTKAQSRVTHCNVTDDPATQKMKCFWDLNTQPHYRQVQEIYNFTLKSVNRYGTREQVFLFYHFKNILSGPPENLSCVNSTTSSLFLYWKVPNSIVPIPTGLEHRILYQCKFGPKIWQNGGIIKTDEKREVYYNLTGLKYAHDLCDIRVAIRVRGADEERMWSANSSIAELTSSTIPGAPPKVTVGSFQTDIASVDRDIYVYWQQVPLEIRNGEYFTYDVVAIDETLNDQLQHSNYNKSLTNAYAKFSGMSLYSSYKFIIRSKNSEGYSQNSVVVKVPPKDELLDEPLIFTKVAFDNGFYKLSWEEPKRSPQYVESYTLFWCSNEKDRPYQCNGYLDWIVVPTTTREYNITVKEEFTTQFAISANNATSSSGMVWASCTLIHNNKLITKIKEVWINSVGSTFIELGWKLDCAERSDNVVGYVIYYCPRGKGPECAKRMNTTITNPNALSGRITGLTPYTTYMLTVSVINTHGSESLESDPLYNTTYEDVPTEPSNLEAVNVTNSSISISWQPPVKINGHLRNYHIYYNNNRTMTRDNSTSFELKDLRSDTMYNISVSACTSQCSNRSEALLIQTNTGLPGGVPNVWTKIENSTLVLHWTKPDSAQGIFEVRRVQKSSDGNTTSMVSIEGDKFDLMDCNEINTDSYIVNVRAVNKDANTSYIGPWSEDVQASCNERESNADLIWMIITFVFVFLTILLVCVGKKLYVHYNDMKTIDVKLPPGLDPQIDTSWTQPKPDTSPSDEVRLLNKTFASSCVDSSGCSSEHTTTSWSNSNSTNSNGYSMYGIPDSSSPEIELTSVPSSQINVDAPYMTCDQIKKPIDGTEQDNGSYTPLKNNLQEKSPVYIMAANKDLMSNLFYSSPIQNADDKAYVQVADASGVLKDSDKTNEKEETPSETVALQNGNGYVSFGDVPKQHLQENRIPVPDVQVTAKTNGYVSFGDASKTTPPKEDLLHTSNGYVSFGDAPKSTPQVKTSPYIPHRT